MRIVAQRADQAPQVIAPNADIAVVHDQEIMSCGREHLGEVTDFGVGSEPLGAMNQLDLGRWKLLPEPQDTLDRRIILLANAKNNFVIRIIL